LISNIFLSINIYVGCDEDVVEVGWAHTCIICFKNTLGFVLCTELDRFNKNVLFV